MLHPRKRADQIPETSSRFETFMMGKDIAQELVDCLELSIKNFRQKTTPRPNEIKRIRAALAAGKAELRPIFFRCIVEKPKKVEPQFTQVTVIPVPERGPKTIQIVCRSLPPRI